MNQSKRNADNHVPILEWIFAAIGLVVVLAACGLLIYKGLVLERRQPQFKATTQHVYPAGDQYAVQAQIENTGGQTVAKLCVHAELKMSAIIDASPNKTSMNETSARANSEATIDFLPADSTRVATFLFDQEPDANAIQYRFKSYQEP